MRALRAGVLVEAAPVDGLGPEVEAAFDLHPVDIEAVSGLDIGTLLALQITKPSDRRGAAISRWRMSWGTISCIGTCTYDVQDRKLVVNEAEAANVRRIFQRFIELGSATLLARELRREAFRNKQGTLIDKGYLYRLLNNRVYRGEALHKGKAYPGEHDAIIEADLWNRVHAILQESPRKRANNSRAQTPALLKGLIFSENGAAMTPTSTKKGAKLYRYYVSMDVIRNRETGEETAPMRLAAGMIEDAVVAEVRRILQTPEVVTQVLAALKRDGGGASEADAIAALHEFNALWSQLFPPEKARIIQLLVRRVTVTNAGLEVDIRREGIAGVIREMVAPRQMEAAE